MPAHKWDSAGSIAIDPSTKTPSKRMDAREENEPKKPFSRYHGAIKNFLPFRPKEEVTEENVMPSGNTLFSYLWANWLSGTMWVAWRKGLKVNSLWALPHSDKCETVVARLEKCWEEELKQKGPVNASLFSACYRSIKTRFFASVVFMTISTIFQFLAPTWLVKSLLDYADAKDPVQAWGWTMLALLLLFLFLRNVSQSAMLALGAHTGSRVIGGLQLLAYKKLLEWRSAHSDALVGQLVNFSSNDMDRVLEAIYLAPMITSVPVMFVACMFYAVYVMGAWVLLGVLTIFIFYPVMSGLAAFVSRIRLVIVRLTDKRVTLMEELAANIRLIKMYAWEQFFADKINRVRTPEQKAQQRAAFLQSITMTMTGSVAILAAVVTFLAFSLAGNVLSAPEVFTVLSIFGAFQFSLGILPQTVRVIAEAAVSLRRLKEFLLFEHPPMLLPLPTEDPDNAIEIRHATFAWDTLNWERKEDEPRRTRRPKSKKPKAPKKPKMDISEQPLTDQELIPNVSITNGAVSVRTGEGTSEEKTGLNAAEEVAKVDEEYRTVLWDIDITVPKGGLVGLCGVVGCGKSSLISAIAGSLKQCAGERRMKGTVAVVSQSAWIFNASIRDNVLFGMDYDAARYARVIEACCLKRDLDALTHGDETEIGERGVNLSGGQKQRVNLARAVYADRDIYLLDDCLSAVDPEVATEIFNSCIRGLLADKAVLLATHSIQLLEKCDYIYHMEDGKVVDDGKFEDLSADSSGAFSSLIRYDRTRPKQKEQIDGPRESAVRAKSPTPMSVAEKELERLGESETLRITVDESKGRGGVTLMTYWGYFKRWGNVCAALFTICLVLMYSASRLLIPIWLQIWVDSENPLNGTVSAVESATGITKAYLEDGRNTTELFGGSGGDITLIPDEAVTLLPEKFNDRDGVEGSESYYQLTFVGLTAIILSVGVAQGYVMCRQLVLASSKLHRQMLASILRAPLTFFDSTPTGRILNRFSRDVDELDVRMPFLFSMVVQGILNVILQLVGVCVYYPEFIIPFCVIVALFMLLDYWLNVGIREVKRIDNVTRSFVLQHINATISGLPIIHSYNKEAAFHDKFAQLVDTHTSSILLYRHTSRWFQCRLELVGNLAILLTALIIVVNGNHSPAQAGVALNFVFQSCGFLPFLLRIKSELQARMTSVERMLELIEDLPQEPADVLPGDAGLADWPSRGEIKMDRYVCRYRPGLPPALKEITVHIYGGEKVGIIGRTGAGKSSLIYALLRLVNREYGAIVIDGVDIETVGLKKLRESVAVIPQDPALFRGTIRSNLDPYGEQSDDAVWQALERAHLKPVLTAAGAQLDSPIGKTDGKNGKSGEAPALSGVNFSVGQRQLLCLARALLKNTKILVLDEATASVDVRTDALIQDTLRSAFQSATVLTIAHRLHTILHYDKILVMEDGAAVEFGKPADLMSRESGPFKTVMQTIGIYSIEELHDYAPENLPFIDADAESASSSEEEEEEEDQYLSCGTDVDDKSKH